jgi:hypothetical protein
MIVTTPLHLGLRLKISGAIHLLLLYAFMAQTVTVSTVALAQQHDKEKVIR